MITIHKFPVDDPDRMPLLPSGSILHIGLDQKTKQPAIWVMCDPTETPSTPAPFVVVMTGGPVPDDAGQYVTTVTGVDGWMVVHFFRRKAA